MENVLNGIQIPYIEKELIKDLVFINEEVLVSEDERVLRKSQLQKAMFLGNTSKGKSKITFVTNEGFKKVETTVWSADDVEVLLKSGTFIPVHAIYKVDLL
ncbi:MAG: hypothetical protein V4658_03060 [Bacteroidota bacterium]